MKTITINERISYIEAMQNPLSADIGIIREADAVWLYDVGNGDEPHTVLNGKYNVVLSHFHPDHIGNIGRIQVENLYVSKETYRYLPDETRGKVNIHIVSEPLTIGNLRIFPIPSSHAKGSLGLEVDSTYSFIGDATYCTAKNNIPVYNTQKLKEEINLLKSLESPYLLVSHYKGLVRKKEEVIRELEEIYKTREKGCNEIPI